MSITLPILKIGNIELDFPVVQAALSGYSDWAMRVIARRHGASYTVCEVMLDQFLLALKKRQKTGHFTKISDEERPVGGQLMGADPKEFALAATKLVEAGFDVIDINFGCPVKKVLGRARGGFHLSQPPVALEIVDRVREAVPDDIPVTVKMRRGVDDTAESEDHFFTIFDGAFDLGVAAITVHGRTVMQRYVGESNWSFLKKLKQQAPDRTILGSGDLFTAKDCLEMIAQTGVDGVTVARGAIGNPWIFRQARALADGKVLSPPSVFEQRDVICEHYRLAEQLYGSQRCGIVMRKFGIKYSQHHPQSQQVRDAFVKVKNREESMAVLKKWYREDSPGVVPESPATSMQQTSCVLSEGSE